MAGPQDQRKGPRMAIDATSLQDWLSHGSTSIPNASALLAPRLDLPQLDIDLPKLWWSSGSRNANCSICSIHHPPPASRLSDRPKASTFLRINALHYHRPSTVSREFRPLVRGRVTRCFDTGPLRWLRASSVGDEEHRCCSISDPSSHPNGVVRYGPTQ